MAIRRLVPNVPLVIECNAAMIMAGRYGPQVSLKGKVNREPTTVFLPGKAWAAVKVLRAAGIIPPVDYNAEPLNGETVELPLSIKNFTVESRKSSTERWPTLIVTSLAPRTGPPARLPAKSGSVSGIPDYLEEQESVERSFVQTSGAAADAHVNGPLAVYKQLTRFVLREIEPMYAEAKLELSPEAAAACTATLFINSQRHPGR